MNKEFSEKNIVKYLGIEYPGRTIKKVRENSQVCVFMCEAKNKDIIPGKIAVAVNKSNLKMGSSLFSFEEAISNALR